MLRRRGYLLGVAAIVVLLVIGIVPSAVGTNGHAAPVNSSLRNVGPVPLASASHVASRVVPGAGSGPVAVMATPAKTATYQTVNFSYAFDLNVTNATIDSANVTITANLTWVATSTLVATSTSCAPPCNLTTTTFPLPSATFGTPWGVGNLNLSADEVVLFPVTTAWMQSMGFNGGDWPQGDYNLTFTVSAVNSSAPGTPATTTWTYEFFLQDYVLSVTNDVATVPVQTVPFDFTYTLNLTNAAITPANLSYTLQLVWVAPGCGSANLFGGAECPVLATTTSCPGTCTNNSTQFQLPTAQLGPQFAWMTRGAQETLNWLITPAVLNSTGVFPSNQYAQGTYQVNMYINQYGNTSNALSAMVTPASPPSTPDSSYQFVIAVTVPTLVVSTTFALYQSLPATLNFTVGASNATPDMNNLTISVEADYVESSGTTELVTNNSVAVNATGASTTYSVSIDQGFLSANNFAGGNLPTGQYLVTVWLTATNSVMPGSSTWTGVTIGRSQHTYFIINPMQGTFLSPDNGSSLPVGNVTFTVQYSGDFLNGANLTVYSGTTPVFVTGVFASGTGPRTTVVNWPSSGAGTFTAVLTLTTPASSGTFSEEFTVVATNNLVYVNHTAWQNSSLIPGLDPAVGGTILLVVGLIVGMIVALFLGRMMWGGARSPAAPQQWTPKTANECSVCHQSFGSETELKDHQKSAHGMT